MANFYVDLSLLTNSHTGTDVDPFSFSDWQTQIGLNNNDTFYLKGIYEGTTATFGTTQQTFLPWSPSTNGPWRIRLSIPLTGTPSSDTVIKGGIIFSSADILLGFAKIYSCYINSEISVGVRSLYGCLVKSVNQMNIQSAYLESSVIDASSFNDSYAIGSYYCAFTVTPAITLNYSITNWVQPVWPAFDADVSEFNTDIIFLGMSEPPQPGYVGSVEYANYNTDLWGNARTGIGTGYMTPVSVAPVWTSTYPKTGTIGLTGAQLLVSTDVTGMAYYVVMPNGTATGPSSLDVINGVGYGGETGINSGSIALDADTEAILNASNLSGNTSYDSYIVATDGASGIQASPSLVEFTTDAIIYIDLSSAGTGHAGTTSDPWSFADWQANLGTMPQSTFYMRGSYTYTGLTSMAWAGIGGHSYLPWDLPLYGPWRMLSTSAPFSIQSSTNIVSGFIGKTLSNSFENINANCYNCFFIIPNGTVSISSPIRGCTIVAALGSYGGQNLYDSVFSIGGSISQGGNTYYNCATNFAEDLACTYVNSQSNVVFPAMPDWNSPINDFSVVTLHSDIDTPPQPGFGSPAYTNYPTDLYGNVRTGIGTGYMGSLPIWTTGYPQAGVVGGTTANILVQTNETGMAYFVVLPNGDTGPSSVQVKNGLNSVGVTGAVGMFGSVYLDADTEASMGITGLTSQTTYDVFVVAENSLPVLQEFSTGINITTTDIIGPVWENGTPSILGIHGVSADIGVQQSETGMVYFVALPDGATGPSSAEVKAGTGQGGETGMVVDAGSVSMFPSQLNSFNVYNLEYNTAYDIYAVGEDSLGNLMASPSLLNVSTYGNIVDLPGSVGIYRFQIIIGVTTFNETHTNLVIPYTTYGNTALVGDLTTYEYSLNGSTWTPMTAADGTVITNLAFTPTGTAQIFTWRIKNDLGPQIYNKNIYIRFIATSGTITTAVTSYGAYFPKIVVNEETIQRTPPLPEDYKGVPGSDLLDKAPKVGK